jgi:signal transduction histidine kinase
MFVMASRYLRLIAVVAVAVCGQGGALQAAPGDNAVSSASFRVLPQVSQTWWFAATLAGVFIAAAVLLYRARVRQLSRVMRAQFDERLAERNRAARELHDTLLQTVHGSKLVADRALRDTGDAVQLARALEQVSAWLGQAAIEGRDALQSLRVSTTETNNLAEAFRRALDECRGTSSAEMVLVVRGEARSVHPVVRDEVYRVGYEAIRNACAHSGAARIDVDLEYGPDLTIRVIDDGVGIDAAVGSAVTPGHTGLTAMRDRAERIGAQYALKSRSGTGTIVTLVVPGRVAFQSE